MNLKYFPMDKNYILQEAQERSRQELLTLLVDHVKMAYEVHFNPLNLVDELVLQIRSIRDYRLDSLEFFYLKVAGIYRYKYGADNQLTFVFDGPDHYEQFKLEWMDRFTRWMDEFCEDPAFVRAVMEASVLPVENKKTSLASNRLYAYVNDRFEVRIRKRRNLPAFKIA